MIPNRDDERRRGIRRMEMDWDDILSVCEEEFGEQNLVMVERVERAIPNWSRSPFSTWVVIVMNDFPHPILFEVNHPRFKIRENEKEE